MAKSILASLLTVSRQEQGPTPPQALLFHTCDCQNILQTWKPSNKDTSGEAETKAFLKKLSEKNWYQQIINGVCVTEQGLLTESMNLYGQVQKPLLNLSPVHRGTLSQWE